MPAITASDGVYTARQRRASQLKAVIARSQGYLCGLDIPLLMLQEDI